MKILIYGLSNNHGGVESFIHNYAMNLSEDIQIDYITDFESVPFEEEFKLRGSNIFYLPSRRKNYREYNTSLIRVFQENRYDAVWMNVCTLSSIEIIIQAKKHGVKTRIVHSHNSKNMGGLTTKILHSLNKKRLTKYTTDFWACSKEAGLWMFPKSVQDIKVINNAIDGFNYDYNLEIRNQLREELNLNEQFVVGNVGRFHHQKNHEFLIKIFNEILKINSKSKLILVGSGDLEKEIRDQITSLNISDKVMFLGQRNDVNHLLQAFDAFLLPSRFEGLPFVLVEAQFSGLNCFTSAGVVSEQTKITDLLKFISLDDEPAHWASELFNTPIDRVSQLKNLENSGFDISSEAKKIEEFFKTRK